MVVVKGTQIKVKINDLPHRTNNKVDAKCDNCNKIVNNINWSSYKKYQGKESNETYYYN